jgi:hypothetical protein
MERWFPQSDISTKRVVIKSIIDGLRDQEPAKDRQSKRTPEPDSDDDLPLEVIENRNLESKASSPLSGPPSDLSLRSSPPDLHLNLRIRGRPSVNVIGSDNEVYSEVGMLPERNVSDSHRVKLYSTRKLSLGGSPEY